jgi:alkanesulfonate monooxygenase SsuD/methylene tetrahydromethanopterin reductase-like flavin-dependent oxidoreductase (luciferase family)
VNVGVVLNGRRTAEEIATLAQMAEDAGVRQLWLSGGARTKDHFLRLAELEPPPLYVGANRPRMISMAAKAADGLMFTDMPIGYLGHLMGIVRSALGDASRPPGALRISNWFVWNIQETRARAVELARQQLGFRLYYIRDVARALDLTESEAVELERRQPEMLRAIFEGRRPWTPSPSVLERLIQHLTLSGGPEDIERCIERLLDMRRAGLTEIAFMPHGDPRQAIRLLQERVLPVVQTGPD